MVHKNQETRLTREKEREEVTSVSNIEGGMTI